MFDDIIGSPKRQPEMDIRCSSCGSYNVQLSDKKQTGIGFRPNNSIYTRYKIYVQCLTCNTAYHLSYIEE